MDRFQSHQIVQVILRVKYGVATDEEKRVFEDWIKAGEEHQALYDKMASDESLKEYLKLKLDYDQATDYGKLHAGILNSLNKRNRQRRIKRYSLWAGSAAAVLLVAGMFLFKYMEPSRDVITRKPYVAKMVSEPKVQDKVILVLADGEKVGMTKIRQDSMRLGTAIVMGQEDRLVYDSDSEQKDSVVFEESEINKIITTTGGFYTLVLSDGTRVWLNSESELEYPVLFGKGKRVVKLTGEAFFEVTKDASRPFIVETNDIRTRVLGTSFNIKAYQNEPAIATTLFTGKVEVALLTDTLRRVVLLPGKQADLNLQTNHLSVGEVNLEHVIAWKEGMFMFNKENIEVVTRQIERWYGVKFIYEAGCHKYYTFNGYLSKDESLKTILDALTFTGGPKFKIDENVVYVKD